jgi:hypothetical protein
MTGRTTEDAKHARGLQTLGYDVRGEPECHSYKKSSATLCVPLCPLWSVQP